MIDIHAFWAAVLRQDADAIRAYFAPDAYVNWHNTNEHFAAEEFVRANCEYPGEWAGQVEKTLTIGNTIVTATHVHTRDGAFSFHVVSFIQMKDSKIIAVDEYWGDDGDAPEWRKELGLGTKIK